MSYDHESVRMRGKKRGAKRPIVCVKIDVCVDPAGLKTIPITTCGVNFQCGAVWWVTVLLPPSPSRRPSSSSTMTDRKAVIKNADMSEDMQQDAVDCATQAMEKYNIEKDIAAYIKKVRQDARDGSEWGSVGLHHWHMICKITAFFILWSIFGQCGDGGSCDQGRSQDFISTEVRSPQAPPPPCVVLMNISTRKSASTSICLFYRHWLPNIRVRGSINIFFKLQPDWYLIFLGAGAHVNIKEWDTQISIYQLIYTLLKIDKYTNT